MNLTTTANGKAPTVAEPRTLDELRSRIFTYAVEALGIRVTDDDHVVLFNILYNVDAAYRQLIAEAEQRAASAPLMNMTTTPVNELSAALQHALDAERLAAAHAERLATTGHRLAALLDEHDAEPRTVPPSDLAALLDQLAELLAAQASAVTAAEEAAEEAARLAGEAQLEADEERARPVPCCLADADEDGTCYHGYAQPRRPAARRRRRR